MRFLISVFLFAFLASCTGAGIPSEPLDPKLQHLYRYEVTEGGMRYVVYGNWYTNGAVVINLTKDSLELVALKKQFDDKR